MEQLFTKTLSVEKNGNAQEKQRKAQNKSIKDHLEHGEALWHSTLRYCLYH